MNSVMLQGWRLMLETVIDDIHPPLMKMEAEAPSVSLAGGCMAKESGMSCCAGPCCA